MLVSDFMKKILNYSSCTFYLNDSLVDDTVLFELEKELDYFEFEDGNVVRIYV